MKILSTALESRSSVAADRLIYTSGLYVIVTSGDYYYGRWDGSAVSAVQCGRDNGFCTSDKAFALQMWETYTANHNAK